ncbi:alpha/beta hydrolase [Mucilaginibacter limnophilus]|uniref:Alpha/beta hydrolase n=1 Tax=Mucilaginibacter limnophilus TaxID=1932778 RepID=A0A3S2Y1P9_9SPHI|nr:alpha/beta hydrolase [Mucilaginibacter limnophilus]RVU01398.1 alpha/beta hydrolase [Mucilaginibacter limnophilus]
MTDYYFENGLVKLHYYKFGEGPQPMLCFHGFGMHGKQFISLEPALGKKYTFYGFDLFFHKQTKLHDQSLAAVKKGISKQELAALIIDFCAHLHINRFSVIAYSMGTHYATAVTEILGRRIDEYILAAPSSVYPGAIIRLFSKNKTGNKLLEKLVLSKRALINMLNAIKFLRLIDKVGRNILYNEIATAELRFNFYACFTYLRFLETNEEKLIKSLTENNIRSIFIFGKRDKMYPPTIGKAFFAKLKQAEVVILDENHEMINQNFVSTLSRLLL